MQKRKDLLTELARRSRARTDLQAFVEFTTPGWQAGKMHRIICEQLDRVVRGEVDRLMLLCPPQHGKSSIASKRFPAYLLGHNPRFDVVSTSATSDLAEEFGRDVRNCIASTAYGHLFKTKLSEDTLARGRWNTSDGGGYYAIGVGGTIFGRGGNLGIIDDPFASWQDAQSERNRELVWEWYRGSFYNRIRPGAPIIVINHRMHEADLSGRLLDEMANGKDKWEVVTLPADLDDPPWPERYDRAALARIKANVSPLMWSGLYMQEPMPEAGTYFQREWFENRRFNPAKLTGAYKYGTGDYAVTHEGGDDTAIGTHGYKNGDLYLGIEGWKGQASADVWIERQCDQFEKHRPFGFFGESGVIRRSIEPFLIRRMRERNCATPLYWLPRPHDKPTMARGLQGLASMGRVWIADTEFGEWLLGQLLGFPGMQKDDGVDMATLMGMALDQAHPALISPEPEKLPDDDGYKAVDGDAEVDKWRAA